MPGPHAARVALIDASIRSAAFDPGLSRPPNRLLPVFVSGGVDAALPASQTRRTGQGRRRAAAAHYKNIWRGMSGPLMQARRSAPYNASHPTDRACRCMRDLCDGAALPPTRQFLAPKIDVRRTAISIAAHAFQRARLATDSRGQIEIIDVDGPAEDPVRALPGDPTG